MKDNLYQPFEIVIQELDESPKATHQQTFFELIYIVSGTGTQFINKNTFEYGAGNLFLVTPADVHSFDVRDTTKFFFIKFNNIYIRNSTLQKGTIQKLEYILQNAHHEPGCIVKNQKEKLLVMSIVEAIIRDQINKDIFNKEFIHQLITTMIVIVARCLAKHIPDNLGEQSDEKAFNILDYIQANIYSPEKINAETIGRHFGISTSYVGRYFKKQNNETMQDYIIRYKLKLIETRLLHSDLRINEIADELGFTDESHMNRIFKKYKQMAPAAFRKAGQINFSNT